MSKMTAINRLEYLSEALGIASDFIEKILA